MKVRSEERTFKRAESAGDAEHGFCVFMMEGYIRINFLSIYLFKNILMKPCNTSFSNRPIPLSNKLVEVLELLGKEDVQNRPYTSSWCLFHEPHSASCTDSRSQD